MQVEIEDLIGVPRITMNVEKVAQELFDLCSDRSKTVSEVSRELCSRLGFTSSPDLEDAVRKYKNSGTGLEATSKKIMESAGYNPVFDAPIGLGFKTTISLTTNNKNVLIEQYKNKFESKYDAELAVNTAILISENFKEKAAFIGINLDTAELKETDDLSDGLYLPSMDRIYVVVDVQTLKDIAIERLVDWISQEPVEAALYGVSGINNMNLEELIDQSSYTSAEEYNVSDCGQFVMLTYWNRN